MTKLLVVLLDDSTYDMLDAFRAFIARTEQAQAPVTDTQCVTALIVAAYSAMRGAVKP